MNQLVDSLACPLQGIREGSLSAVEKPINTSAFSFKAFSSPSQNPQSGLVRDQKSVRVTRQGALACAAERSETETWGGEKDGARMPRQASRTLTQEEAQSKISFSKLSLSFSLSSSLSHFLPLLLPLPLPLTHSLSLSLVYVCRIEMLPSY